MHLFEWIIALLLGAVVLTAAARRVGLPYPTLLAAGGALLALAPAGPRLALDPALALALFIAPVLLDAGYDASPRDLRDNWAPIAGLVVVAVGVTTAAVAWVARLLVPDLPLAAAVALGAIVAPPDAAAATAVLRQVRIPHRLLVVLEGESLLNDASSLLIYKLAVGAAAAGSFSAGRVAPTLAFVLAGSVVAGAALARAYLWATRAVRDVPSSIVLQFGGTFAVWILAERAGLSAVLTVVSYAMTIARRAPARVPARMRVPSYAAWDLAVFVLNVLAFVLVGLQLRPILEPLGAAERGRYLAVAAAVLGTVLVVRPLWVMAYNAAYRARVRRRGMRGPRPLQAPTVRAGIIVSWCGMRGIVSLAAALALPARFPYRDLLVLCAFAVVLGTLVIQGATLRPLLARLRLGDDRPVEREVGLAREAGLRAALASLDRETAPELAPAVAAIRQEYAEALERAPTSGDGPPRLLGDGPRRRAVAAARRATRDLLARGEIGDDAYHRLEEELDWLELGAGGAAREEAEGDPAGPAGATRGDAPAGAGAAAG